MNEDGADMAFVNFQAKRNEWLTWFDLGNPWSIWSRILRQNWNEGFFRSFNELRRIQIEAGITTTPLFLDSFLLDGFIAGQTLTIRQLCDPNDPKNPKKGVVSLKRFIDELKEFKAVFTSENFVTYDGEPYEFEIEKQKWSDELAALAALTPGQVVTYSDPDWKMSEKKHKLFDEFSGKSEKERRPDDTICAHMVTAMDKQLRQCQNICDYANKRVAHNPDVVSLQSANQDHLQLTLDKIRHANRILSGLARFIYGQVLWAGDSLVFPTPKSDPFKNCETPFIATEYRGQIRKFFKEFREQINNEKGLSVPELFGSPQGGGIP